MEDFFTKDNYSFEDIESLISNSVEESINLDFKAAQSLSKEDRKKTEITKDVAAFANSAGGIIIYGVNEKDHKAESVSFVDGNEYTKEWLEQIINTSIQRRIDGIRIYPVRKDGDIGKTIYIVKIPESFDTPHISRDGKYYKRYNFQSAPMEEYEVRQSYERKSKSKLIVNSFIVKVNEETLDDDEVSHTFRAHIHNIGKATETLYKVNLYLIGLTKNVRVESDRSNKINLSWMGGGRIKVSFTGSEPIFSDEALTMMDLKIIFPRDYPKVEFGNIKMKLIVLYGNGMFEGKERLLCDVLSEEGWVYEN